MALDGFHTQPFFFIYREKKECQVMAGMHTVKKIIRQETANSKVTVINLVLNAVGRTGQVSQEQRSKDASIVGNLDFLQGSASRGGQGSSVAVLQLQ